MTKINLKNSNIYAKTEDSIAGMGEDIVIKKMLSEMQISTGWVVDVGSWDGWHLSNVGLLLQEGFGGILIEVDGQRVERSKERWSNRNDIIHHQKLVDLEENTLDRVFAESETPIDFDVLNIDIDSYEFWIWKSVSYKPKIVCIEHNGNIIDVDATIPYLDNWKYNSSTDNYGSSAQALYRLAIHKGYALVSASRHNLIFCDTKYSHLFETFDQIDASWFKSVLGINPHQGRIRMPDSYFVFNPEVE